MRIPNPKAVTTTEAYLAYKAEVLEQSELKDKLYHPYLHIDGWLAYWTGLTTTYPVKNVGKNLFDADYYENATYTTGTYKYVETNFAAGETYTFTAQLKPGKTAISGLYVYISTASNPNSAPESQRMAAIYNGSTTASTGTSSIPSGATLYFQFYSTTTDITQLFDTYEFQLEYGSSATPYEPYTGNPECLTDEEAYIAYLAGVTSEYPEALKDPADVRVASYLRYLISARFGRPDYPVTREEFYLSMMKPRFIPSGDPSSEIELDGTVEEPFVDVKMYGDTFQQTYSGANLFNYTDTVGTIGSGITVDANGFITCTFDNSAGSSTDYQNYFTNNLSLQTDTNYAIVAEIASVSGQGVFCIASGNSSSSQMSQNKNYDFSELNNGDIVVWVDKTKADFTGTSNGLRNFFAFSAGRSGSITVRISVIADTSVTPQTFVYQPFTGNMPSPNPDYPQDIDVVTGEQTVEVHGKNLLNIPNFDLTQSGIRGVCKDGVIEFTGTAGNTYYPDFRVYADGTVLTRAYRSTASQINTSKGFFTKPNTPYKLSVFVEGNTSYNIVEAFETEVSNNLGITGNQTFTIDRNERLNFISISFVQNVTANIKVKIQLEQGSTATTYEPYQAQSYEINLGKNIIDFSTINYIGVNGGNGTRVGGTYTVDGGSDSWGGVGFAQDNIQLEPNTTYTFSATVQSTTNPNGSAVFANRFINTTGTYILGNYAQAGERSVVTFTTPDSVPSTGDLRLLPRVSNSTAVFTDIQLEKGSTATPYAPYFEPIELCKIGDYQDYIYRDEDGDWYVHKDCGEYVFTGSESWQSSPYGTNSWNLYNILSSPFDTTKLLVMSEAFRGVPHNQRGSAGDNIIYVAGNNLFEIRNTSLTSLANVQSATNGTALYYALATTTDTQITNSELISQLDALMEGGSYNGKTYIKVTATDPNLPGLLYVEAAI